MKLLKTALFFLSFAAFASCSKEKDPVAPEPTKTKAQLLSAHKWKYDKLVHNYHSGTPVTVYQRGNASNEYNLDGDTYTFNISGTFNVVLTSSPSNFSGRWNLIPDDSQIEIRDPNGVLVYTADILTIDENNYIFTYADQDSYAKLMPY